MKDIKSMIIGFLMATCMFLFIGATTIKKSSSLFNINPKTADRRYQIADTEEAGVLMLDTTNGDVYEMWGVGSKNPGNWSWHKQLDHVIIN